MEQNELQHVAEDILTNHQIGTLASVKNDKPFSRYMTFFHEGYTLYTATDKHTHKVDDLSHNPNVHVLLGYTYDGTTDAYLEIEGKASIEDNKDTKQKIWNEKLEPWFNGPEDPNYTVLKIDPSEIRLMNTKEEEAQVLDLN